MAVDAILPVSGPGAARPRPIPSDDAAGISPAAPLRRCYSSPASSARLLLRPRPIVLAMALRLSLYAGATIG